MSVIIRAVSVVVPRRVLDLRYPGGCLAYVNDVRHGDSPTRFVCRDEHLTSVSCPSTEDARRLCALLASHGVRTSGNPAEIEIALIHEWTGQLTCCHWVECERARCGTMYGRFVYAEAGHARALEEREEERDMVGAAESADVTVEVNVERSPSRYLRLSREAGSDTWLDFSTGQLVQERALGGGTRCVVTPLAIGTPETDGPVPLLDMVCEALAACDIAVERSESESHAASFRLRGEAAEYPCHVLTLEDEHEYILYIRLPVTVPVGMRMRVSELLTRANYGTPVGNFELGFADGDLHFKIGIAASEHSPAADTMHMLLSTATSTCDRLYGPLMRVINAGISPVEAIREFERGV